MNNENNQNSIVFDTFDKAVEYTTELLNQSLKDADIPLWARAKVAVAGYIDSGIKIKSAWGNGDGTLEIMDANGYDKLILGKDINKTDIKITQEADGFVYLRFDSSADVIKFKQSTSTGGLAIDRIDFTEGGTISSTQILASIKTLTDNNDTLTGNKYGTNNIEALAGDDTITGGLYAYSNIDDGWLVENYDCLFKKVA
jgi:hypothetical protein